MTYIVLLFLVFIIISVWGNAHKRGGQTSTHQQSSCAECTGASEKCEQECMMEAATREIEYYDDEELDIYKARPSDQYTDAEAEEFAEVLHTMRQEEVAGWCRSLTLRGIDIPDQLKDEIFMLIEE